MISVSEDACSRIMRHGYHFSAMILAETGKATIQLMYFYWRFWNGRNPVGKPYIIKTSAGPHCYKRLDDKMDPISFYHYAI